MKSYKRTWVRINNEDARGKVMLLRDFDGFQCHTIRCHDFQAHSNPFNYIFRNLRIEKNLRENNEEMSK